MPKFMGQIDSFNAHFFLNLLLNVTFISIFMTMIGAWIGTRSFDLEPIKTFFYNWPRNFGVAFWIELVIA